MFRRSAAIAALLVLAVPTPVAMSVNGAAARADNADPSRALYDGRVIDLDDGSWDGAAACVSNGTSTRCFDTEAAAEAWMAANASGPASSAQSAPAAAGMPGPMVLTCSSSLRLFQHGMFGGRVLYLSSRGLWFNLSPYGFNNMTSSFVVGACTVYLADGTNGSGSWYPGGYPNQVVGVMASGWNDRITSVYVV